MNLDLHRKHSVFRRMTQNYMFYICVLPFFTVFILFSVFPIVASFFLGFTRWRGYGTPEFVGLRNYVRLFNDPTFIQSLFNTLHMWFFSTLITLGLAMVLAFLVNHYIVRGRSFFRIVFLFPLLVAPALTSIIISVLFSANAGLVNAMISLFVEGNFTFHWLGSAIWTKPLIILIIVWRWTGWHFIVMLAGLQTIPTDLYDAAKIDGASGRKIFQHITLPLMAPIILVSAIIATVGSIQLFDEPYVLTQGTGGVLNSGLSMGMYLYQTAFENFQFGLAAAQSYVLFAIIVLVSLVNAWVMRNRT